jgi:hypothetical protein
LDELILALTKVLELSGTLTKGEGPNVGKVLAWGVYENCQSTLRQIELAVNLKQIEVGQNPRDAISKYTVPDGYQPPIFVKTCSRCKGSGLEP